MKTILTVFLLLLSYAVFASASASALPKAYPVPGGLAIINIPMHEAEEPKVYFSGNRVTVIPTITTAEKSWLALVGIPLDTQPGKQQIRIEWPGKPSEQQTFNVKDKDYPAQHLTIKDKNKVNPSQEDLKRIWVEQKRISKAKASWLDNIPDFNMHLPTEGPLSSQFGLRRYFNQQPRNPHSGLDIAAPSGSPIRAPADGIVIETGDFFYSGNCVFIDHGRGLISFYGHMSRVDVRSGQIVKRGELLGAVGATGRVTGAHLHWAIGLNGAWIDPTLFLSAPTDEERKTATTITP